MVTSQSNRCFLVSVGTSILEKYKEYNSSIAFNVQQLNEDLKEEDIQNLINNDIDKIYQEILAQDKQSVYNSIKNLIESKTSNNDKLNIMKCYSAEAKTLIIYGIKNDDKVILFPTMTYSGVICSYILKNLLKDVLKLNDIEIVFSKGLASAKNKAFVTEGLPNFLSNIVKKIEDNQEKYEIIIVATGGYKSLVPYLTLAGILYKKKIIYIYEDSDKILELPNMPVDIDFERFKINYPLLRNINNADVDSYKVYYDNLQEDFKTLIESKDEEGKTVYIHKSILTFLINRYLSLNYKSSLTITSQKDTLIKYLERDNNKLDLRRLFIKFSEISPNFWLGDKIPEMVDHALKHHSNLFEITELILLPILNKDKNFLSPEYLFILLSAIYFHDWGHSLSYFPGKEDRLLLPTEIRDYHHILGYERLKNEAWRNKLFDLLNLTELSINDADSFWNNYLHAISLIGLYHRKDMPICGDDTFYCPINKSNYKSLEETIKNVNFEEKTLDFEEMKFIVSLFRVIDSIDTQYTRIESIDELIFKISILLNDKKAFEIQSERIKKLIGNIGNSDIINQLDELYKKISGEYTKSESEIKENGKSKKKKEIIDVDSEIGKIVNSDDDKKELALMYLNSKLSAYIKEEQLKHYMKHLYLEIPKIHYENNGEHKIIIEYRKNKNFDKYFEKILKIFTNDLSERAKEELNKFNNDNKILENIVEKISEDYIFVKDYLKTKKLIFEFRSQKD